jgi:hypothetical protein
MKKLAYLLALLPLTVVCWLSEMFFLGIQSFGTLVALTPVGWLLALALAYAIRRASAGVWLGAGLVLLALLLLPTSWLTNSFPTLPLDPTRGLGTPLFLLVLCAALAMAAVLLYAGLSLGQQQPKANLEQSEAVPGRRRHAGRTAAACLVLSAALIAKSLHTFYWFMIWDNTGDSLSYLWLVLPGPILLCLAALLGIFLPGKHKLVGLLPVLFIPAMIAVSAGAQRVDFRQLTAARAERAGQAIEAYYAREGRYPPSLRQLAFWHTLSLPGPVILYGQDWCYDGGDGYYRLGYVDHEHWSSPYLNGQVYQAGGQAPDLPGICSQEIATLEQRFPFFSERK